MKMKKMIFLMVLSFLGITASMNAQVRIGGETTPHQSAVLDLNVADNVDNGALGLALPRVSDFPASPTKGLVVYSTGAEPGLYVWDGSKWNTLKTCSPPATPAIIAFSPAFKDVPDTVNVNTIVTATIAPVVGATSYTWNIPDGVEIQGLANGNKVTLRATTLGNIDGSQFTVTANSDCGSNPARAGLGLLNVRQPVARPDQPTFNLVYTTIDEGSTTTLTCSDVGADTYEWQIPDGLGGNQNTTTNSVVVTGVTPGTYSYAKTPPFRVRAKYNNVVAVSNFRNAGGDSIVVGNAIAVPIIDSIPDMTALRSAGARFTLTPRIITSGNTTYEWTVPTSTGLTVIDGTSNSSITLQTTAPGNVDGSIVRLKVINSLGSVTSGMLGKLKILGDGLPGPDLVVEPNEYHPDDTFTYQTWIFPENIGTWMITNSNEGAPTHTRIASESGGQLVSLYTVAEKTRACPAGWVLPDANQFRTLIEYMGLIESSSLPYEMWLTQSLPGHWDALGWAAIGVYGGWLDSSADTTGRLIYNARLESFTYTVGSVAQPLQAYSARCVKQ
jgi:hypothetical protein